MIQDVHPGSGSLIFTLPDPRSRGSKSTGSRIRIRNTALLSIVILGAGINISDQRQQHWFGTRNPDVFNVDDRLYLLLRIRNFTAGRIRI
jgi:hypothetical protein